MVGSGQVRFTKPMILLLCYRLSVWFIWFYLIQKDVNVYDYWSLWKVGCSFGIPWKILLLRRIGENDRFPRLARPSVGKRKGRGARIGQSRRHAAVGTHRAKNTWSACSRSTPQCVHFALDISFIYWIEACCEYSLMPLGQVIINWSDSYDEVTSNGALHMQIQISNISLACKAFLRQFWLRSKNYFHHLNPNHCWE